MHFLGATCKVAKKFKDKAFLQIGLEESPPANDVKNHPSVLNHIAH